MAIKSIFIQRLVCRYDPVGSESNMNWFIEKSKIIFKLTCLSVRMSVSISSRNGHLGCVVYQGPDKVLLSNFNVILSCHPGGVRKYPRSGYFLVLEIAQRILSSVY